MRFWEIVKPLHLGKTVLSDSVPLPNKRIFHISVEGIIFVHVSWTCTYTFILKINLKRLDIVYLTKKRNQLSLYSVFVPLLMSTFNRQHFSGLKNLKYDSSFFQ